MAFRTLKIAKTIKVSETRIDPHLNFALSILHGWAKTNFGGMDTGFAVRLTPISRLAAMIIKKINKGVLALSFEKGYSLFNVLPKDV